MRTFILLLCFGIFVLNSCKKEASEKTDAIVETVVEKPNIQGVWELVGQRNQ